MNSSIFVSESFWRTVTSSIFGSVSFFQYFGICQPILFWPESLLEKSASLGAPLYYCFLLVGFKVLFLDSWQFNCNMCQYTTFQFNLSRIPLFSCILRSPSLPMVWGSLQPLCGLNVFSVLFLSVSGIPVIWILFLFIVSCKSYRLVSLSFFFLVASLIE